MSLGDLIPYALVLLIVGSACGFINTLASSGSAISLPMLMMLGLPALAANATNRLPVLFGSLMALRTFQTQGKVDWSAAWRIVLPATLGSAVGVYLAEIVPHRDLGIMITAAVLIALLMLFTKVKEALAKEQLGPPRVTLVGLSALFAVGLWLGFLVLDGATYLLLVLILLFRYDLPHANALKVFLLVATTFVPIVLFMGAGNIRWTEGVLLSVGSLLGGHFGAKLSSHMQARVWVFRILVAVILLELVHLGIQYFGPLLEVPRPPAQISAVG
jgi:uncharacterized membrane protein YfcA